MEEEDIWLMMTPLASRALIAVFAIGFVLTIWGPVQFLGRQGSFFLKFLPSSLRPETALSLQPVASRRVVAVADLHGDLQHAHNVLRMADLIDFNVPPNWTGGHDVLISTGDIVDRGDDTIELYKLFMRLRDQAKASGGEVRNCVGNHEMMNAMVDWRYVTPGDIESFGGKLKRRRVISREGWIGKEWLSNYNISHTVELLSSSHVPSELSRSYSVPRANFVHGGVHPTWAQKGLEHINSVGHHLLTKSLGQDRPSGWVPPDASPEEVDFYGEHGPLWYRGFALEEEKEVCHEADDSRRELGVRHLVMGQ